MAATGTPTPGKPLAPLGAQMLIVPETRTLLEEGKALAGKYRHQQVVLKATLSASVTSGQATFVPGPGRKEKALVRSVRAFFAANDSTFNSGSVTQSNMFAFAQNIRAQLLNSDTNVFIVGDRNPATLASLLAERGARPFKLNPAHELAPGQTLKMQCSAIQAPTGTFEFGYVVDLLLIAL